MKLLILLSCLLVGMASGNVIARMKRNAALCTVHDFNNGVYVVADPDKCHRFFICSAPATAPVSRSCPIGNFFDANNHVCVGANAITCARDKCVGDTAYAIDTACGAYCTCENGKTTACMCCPRSQRFEEGRCVASTGCIKPCEVSMTTPGCTLAAHASDNTMYVETLRDGSTVDRNCARGTTFVAVDCACSAMDVKDPLPPACGNSLDLPFDSNTKDKADRVYIETMGTVSTNSAGVPSGYDGSSAATFDGNSLFKVYSYSYGWYGDKFVVRFSFLEKARSPNLGSGAKEQLVTNGEANGDATFSVYYQRHENQVYAKVKSKTLVVNNVPSGQWKNVDVRYDGAEIKLTVNGVTDTATENGNIPATPVPLQIGGGINGENFAGYLDAVTVFKCLAP